MTFVKDKSWERYKKIVNKFIDNDSGRQPFIWLHKVNQPSAYSEDGNVSYIPTVLEGLFQYNYIKTWVSNQQRNSISGELDNGDQVLYISANLLKKGNLLNNYGYWDFNWAEDRFIINGKVYQPGGDTQVAQAKDVPLLFFVILQRISPEEQEKLLQGYSGPELKIVNSRGIFLRDVKGKFIRDLLNQPISVEGEQVSILQG